jgi:hypothetical protein
MKKILIVLSLILTINTSKAGLYDSQYFEPVAGCLVAGGLGYATGGDNAMRNGAIFCAAAGLVIGSINYHYHTKYGEEFQNQIEFLDNRIIQYNLLESQSKEKKEALYFKRTQEVIPPRILENGQGIGPRVRDKLIMIDSKDRVGE